MLDLGLRTNVNAGYNFDQAGHKRFQNHKGPPPEILLFLACISQRLIR